MMTAQTIHVGGTARSPEDVRALSDMGLTFAEIPITRPDAFADRLSEFKEVKAGTGLFFLCHGPREGDPNNTETLESVYLPKLNGVLSLMPELGMRILTVHLWMDSRFVKLETLNYKIDLLDRLTKTAFDTGVTICLENLSERAEDLTGVMEKVPLLMVTLDMGHAQLLSEENTGYRLIERYPGRIGHIHLHDNRGGSSPSDDLHLPVGEGDIDFEPLFQRLHDSGYERTVTLELRPEEIKRCLSKVKRLLSGAGFETKEISRRATEK